MHLSEVFLWVVLPDLLYSFCVPQWAIVRLLQHQAVIDSSMAFT
jgi:hypothetical protein